MMEWGGLSVMRTWLILGSSRFYTLPAHFGKMNINYDKENSCNKK